jgi:hypothetical protein
VVSMSYNLASKDSEEHRSWHGQKGIRLSRPREI